MREEEEEEERRREPVVWADVNMAGLEASLKEEEEQGAY